MHHLMKLIRLLAPALLIAAFTGTGCVKEHSEEEYTSLEELAKTASSSPKRFDINVKDVVVTSAVKDNTFLEDNSGAVLVEQNSCGLVAGQSVTGPLKGMIVSRNGCAVISSLDYGEATVSEGAKIPRTRVTVKELQNSISPNISRRVHLKGIYVDAGIEPGSEMQRCGYIVQDEARMKIYNKSGDAEILTGQIGNITAFPFRDEYGPMLLIYTSDQFSQDDTEYGRYDFTDEEDPEMLESYVKYNQLSIGEGRFRVMNYEEKWASEFRFDPSAFIGAGVKLTITTIGQGVESSGEADCEVISNAGGKIWLKKKGSTQGYIIGTAK